MFENILKFFKKAQKEKAVPTDSKSAAKERLHLVLMQDRAHVSADFLDMMKQEIVDVIKKYIDVDENEMDVKLENKVNEDGTSGAPALYANIPIVGINEDKKKESQEIAKAKETETKTIEAKAREVMAKKKKAGLEKKSDKKKDSQKNGENKKEKKVTEKKDSANKEKTNTAKKVEK